MLTCLRQQPYCAVRLGSFDTNLLQWKFKDSKILKKLLKGDIGIADLTDDDFVLDIKVDESISLCSSLFNLKYGRMEIAPISALLIMSWLGKLVPVRRVFSRRGKPLAPVPPKIELMINILSPESKSLAKV